MRVLNVQLKHTHGGNPQVCLNYTQVLRAAGNEVFVLVNPAEPFIEQNKAFGAEVMVAKRIGDFGSYDLLTILYFKKVISQVRPDVIIAHEGRSAALMKRAAGSLVPVIDVNHGRSAKQSRLTDATIVTNSSQLKHTRAFLGESRLVYNVPNSIDLSGSAVPQFPKEWHNPPVIGTIGRLVKDKALDVFIEALKILKEQNVAFTSIMAGEGEERASLENQISEYGLGEVATLPGWAKKPDEFYSKIDIFCFPSRKEEFGLVMLEAWKNGLPAVVSDADGPADIANANSDALVVPKENPQELAGALRKVIKNKKLADGLAVAGYNRLKEKYDVQMVARQLQGIIEEVLAQKTSKNKGRKAA